MCQMTEENHDQVDLEVAAFEHRCPLHLGVTCATPHVSPPTLQSPELLQHQLSPLGTILSIQMHKETSPIFKISKNTPLDPHTHQHLLLSLCNKILWRVVYVWPPQSELPATRCWEFLGHTGIILFPKPKNTPTWDLCSP